MLFIEPFKDGTRKGFKSIRIEYWFNMISVRGPTYSIYMTIIISILAISIPVSVKADQNGTRAPEQQEYSSPEITVILDSTMFHTIAGSGPQDQAIISGNITCIIPEYVPDSVFVELKISLIGVDVMYDGLDEFYATKDESTVAFRLNFYSMPDARAGDEFDFELQTLWEYSHRGTGSGRADSVYGSVRITAYGYISLSSMDSKPTFDVTIGERYSYRLDLRNQANSESSIEINIIRSPPGVEVEVKPSSITMIPFNTKVIEILIYQEDGDAQEGEITLQVRNDASGELVIDEYSYLYISSRNSGMEPEIFLSLLTGGAFLLVFTIVMVVFILIIRRRKKKWRALDGSSP